MGIKISALPQATEINPEDLKVIVQGGTTKQASNIVVWDDLRAPATQLRVNPATSRPDFDAVNVGYSFDPTGVETVFIVMQLPHSYKEGSDIEPHVH